MKNTKVKGFTLIELLVVMAIFGIIMAGAMQLIPSVTKMMVQSTVHEDGNAAVSSISKYLESELSPAEYLIVSNSVPSDSDREELVKEHVLSYYEGVLVNGATPDAPVYGTGKVHVMTIDNDKNGQISKWVYDVKFDVPDKVIESITPSDFITGVDSHIDSAINKAYYDTYNFNIRAGTYDDASAIDPDDPETFENLIGNVSANNTTFTISAATNRRRNGQIYNFRTTASMSLTNLHHRGGGGVAGTYYVVNQAKNGSLVVNSISDITKDSAPPLSRYPTKEEIENGTANDFNMSRHYGFVAVGSKVFYEEAPTTNGYTFVYSYGSEMCPENKKK